ncbi:MAG: HD domain-containing protein, partial [Bacteroidota bacterium]|nr:HD domain-containing protein [Bacteroidota bacterium]
MDAISQNIKEYFKSAKEKLFNSNFNQQNPLSFSMEYSLLVEELIRSLSDRKTYPFALVSAGSFSRRELSPFSDIDIIFIVESLEGIEQEISSLIQAFWDSGLEVSHTIRDFNDINKYLSVDLKTFTQFFETRFLLGNEKLYNKWNVEIFDAIDETAKVSLLDKFVEEIEERYKKYGDSPKVLEPNVKLTAGGLRDFQSVEWMFIIYTKTLFNKQSELSQAESFIQTLSEKKYTSDTECFRLLQSYRLILSVRNLLHFINHQKNDRFEFKFQNEVAAHLSRKPDNFKSFMKEYFEATNSINRFLKSMIKKFQEEIANPLPDSLSFNIDDDFSIKGKELSLSHSKPLSLSDILRSFYYRGFYGGYFDEKLRTRVIETIENKAMFRSTEAESSVFFREILRLPKNVGTTLSVMNELGVIGAFMPEWNEMVGFFQPGVYHCYTVDEHTLIAIMNVEKLEKDFSLIARIYKGVKNKEILFLSLLLHDIAKPVDVSGHEIIGAELTSSVMTRMGYSDEEIEKVTFLVRNHLVMEQTAFRRNLNDPETLNNFAAKFNSVEALDMLFLLTYGDLSAVNSNVWTSWKSDLASELYLKTKEMLEEQITAEELLASTALLGKKKLTKLHDQKLREHIESMNDISYQYHFSETEILEHVTEIQKGELIS